MYKRIKKACLHPITAVKVVNRRHFQFNHNTKDPEVRFMKSWIYGNLKRKSLVDLFPGIENESYQVVSAYKRVENMSITLLEINAILAIQKFIKATTVFEIGTFDGGATLNVSANLPEDGLVYTVDLPADIKTFELEISGFMNNQSDFENVGIQYKGTKYQQKIKQIFEDSGKINYEQLPVPFDMFFIDGCHDYEYVKNDSQMA